jgi:hypothetical protein
MAGMWSLPAVVLCVVLALGGASAGPITLGGSSLAIPIFIIGLVPCA